ncbi:MAG: 6-pyruvoyl trahydropterin synthase family protein [Planctomycetota bacterium]
MERYTVRLTGDDLMFSAAHFISFGSEHCERLHGHNYRVVAEVSGPLDGDALVVDFVALKQLLREELADLDHRVLLPTQSEHFTLHDDRERDEVTVAFGARRWVFPRGDCALLPVSNTTAESTARLLARSLFEKIRRRTQARVEHVRVEVCESSGCAAACEVSGD